MGMLVPCIGSVVRVAVPLIPVSIQDDVLYVMLKSLMGVGTEMIIYSQMVGSSIQFEL